MSNSELSDSQIYAPEQLSPMLTNESELFQVRFWGIRGLIPTPSKHNSRYGGNTGCVEMYIAGKRLIFDGGTGLRILGGNWREFDQSLEAHLFFTNSQSNRIQGFPFFAPAFIAGNSFHVYGTAASNGASIKQCLCDQMLQPHFPYPFQVMESALKFHNLMPGQSVDLDDIKITTSLINKSQRSIGYRVNWGQYNVVYAADLHKTINSEEQTRILEIIQDADLWITNSTYMPPTDNKHETTESFWKTAVDMAQKAQVKKLVISYHHPDDHDDFLDDAQIEIQSVFPKALLAREGLVLTINVNS
jgi:phosphoribosyl 1,2-cyclic phosphodiesterase